MTTLGWYVYVVKARKDNYRDFYAVYDADKDYERMKVCGEEKISTRLITMRSQPNYIEVLLLLQLLLILLLWVLLLL